MPVGSGVPLKNAAAPLSMYGSVAIAGEERERERDDSTPLLPRHSLSLSLSWRLYGAASNSGSREKASILLMSVSVAVDADLYMERVGEEESSSLDRRVAAVDLFFRGITSPTTMKYSKRLRRHRYLWIKIEVTVHEAPERGKKGRLKDERRLSPCKDSLADSPRGHGHPFQHLYKCIGTSAGRLAEARLWNKKWLEKKINSKKKKRERTLIIILIKKKPLKNLKRKKKRLAIWGNTAYPTEKQTDKSRKKNSIEVGEVKRK